MKILFVVACLWVASVGVLQSPDNNGTPKHNGAGGANPSGTSSQGENSPSNSLPNGIVLNCNQGREQGPDPSQYGQRESQHDDDVKIQRKIAEFTKWLVVVGFLQFLALLGTLAGVALQAILMKAHANHLKCLASAAGSNAVAAKLNAQALINAERPWVMVQTEVVMGDNPAKAEFKLSAFNYGKSPAHITACNGPKVEVVSSNQSLPVPPIYGNWEWDNTFLAPKDSIPLRDAVNPWEAYKTTAYQAIADHVSMPKDNYVVVYGLIEYGDGISGQTYKTAYCYTLKRNKLSDMGGTLIRYGPREYNAYT